MAETTHHDAVTFEVLESAYRRLIAGSGIAVGISDQRYRLAVDEERSAVVAWHGNVLSMLIDVEDVDFVGGKRPVQCMTAQRAAGGQVLTHTIVMELSDGVVHGYEASEEQSADAVHLFLQLCDPSGES